MAEKPGAGFRTPLDRVHCDVSHSHSLTRLFSRFRHLTRHLQQFCGWTSPTKPSGGLALPSGTPNIRAGSLRDWCWLYFCFNPLLSEHEELCSDPPCQRTRCRAWSVFLALSVMLEKHFGGNELSEDLSLTVICLCYPSVFLFLFTFVLRLVLYLTGMLPLHRDKTVWFCAVES